MPSKVERLRALADRLEARAAKLRQAARDIYFADLRSQRLENRLVYASTARCACGAGLAYDPGSEVVQRGRGYWDCSAVLKGEAADDAEHTPRLPFVFYEIKSERQPGGVSTRPRE